MAEATTNKSEPGCCPPGSIGKAAVLSERPLKGTMVDIPAPSLQGMEPIPCYCTGAPLASASQITVIFTDVYGIDAGHHKVFADCLAEQIAINNDDNNDKKCCVVIPDLFRGQPILRPWIASTSFAKDIIGSALGAPGMVYRIKKDYPPQKVEQDIFQAVLPWLQHKAPTATRLSCVGFCFGGWVVGRVLGYYSTNKEQDEHSSSALLSFQCGVGIHPSFQPNIAHGESQLQMAERISKPMLLLPARNDVHMKIGTKVVDIMTKTRQDNGEEDPEVSIEFPTMIHGWVTRGDPTDPKVAAEQERALQLTVAFLQKNSP